MNPLLAAAGISAGAQLLGNAFNLYGTSQANQANMELAQYQYEKNLEMWHRQNEYNTPAAQIARLRAAGLNPVLAMSGGVTNTAGNAPQYDRPNLAPYQVDTSGLASIGSSLMTAQMDEKKVALMESQTDLIKAKVATEDLIATLKNLQGSSQFMENQYMSEIYPLLKDTVQANLNLINGRGQLTQEQIRLTQEEINAMPVRYALMKAEIRRADATTQRIYVECAKTALENILLEAKTQYADKIAYAEANILSSRLAALGKLNSLRDLDKWIKETNLEFLPSIYRAQILKAAVDSGTAFMKFGAFGY